MSKSRLFFIGFALLFFNIQLANATTVASAKVDVTELFLDANTGLIGFKITNATDPSEHWVNCGASLVHYHRRAGGQPINERVTDVITSTV
ncbi:MAG: hypothetical protein ACI8WB_005417, partial [Phenylobacterium sp.]